MIKLRYFCPQQKGLPKTTEYKTGMTIGHLMEQLKDELGVLVEYSLAELSFITDNKVAAPQTELEDEQEVLILKPTSGG